MSSDSLACAQVAHFGYRTWITCCHWCRCVVRGLANIKLACLPIPLPTSLDSLEPAWHWKVFDRDWLQLPLGFACTHGRSRRTLDDPIRFVNYRTFFPKWLACASKRAFDIQTRETDSANVCSGEGNHKMLLARLPLCLPEEGDAQKGGALAHAMAQALEKTATASPLGLLEEKPCPSSVHGVCGIHG